MATPSHLDQECYKAWIKFQRNLPTALVEAYQEGFKEGFEQGFKEGLERGRKEGHAGIIHFCQGLLRGALMPTAELLALPLADLKRLAEQLKAELTRSLPHLHGRPPGTSA